MRSHSQKFFEKLEKNPEIEGNDLKDLLNVNLRNLTKSERLNYHAERVKPQEKVKVTEQTIIKEKYTIMPNQKLFKVEKVKPKTARREECPYVTEKYPRRSTE